MGVSTTLKDYYYDNSDLSARTPLLLAITEEKSFADGQTYSFNQDFDFALNKEWNGPCLHLRASVG